MQVSSLFLPQRKWHFNDKPNSKWGHLEIHNKCVLVRQKIGKWPPASSHINFGSDAFSALSQELQIFIKSIKIARMLNVSFRSGNLHYHIKKMGYSDTVFIKGTSFY